MTCPKCGAVDQRGAECGDCGIVFARWRPRPDTVPGREAVPPPAAQLFGMPAYRTFVPVVSTLLFFGLLWAYARGGRPERRSEEPHPVAQEQTTIAQEPGSAPRISNEEIIALIEKCSYFQERIVVKIPRSVYPNMMRWVDSRVILAVNMQIVQLDPPFDAARAAHYLPNPAQPGSPSEIKPGPNPQGIPLSETAEGYEIDVGRRKVAIEHVYYAGDRVTAVYRWTVEDPRLLYFAPDSSDLQGGAELHQTSSGWKARVWRNTRGGSPTLCESE